MNINLEKWEIKVIRAALFDGKHELWNHGYYNVAEIFDEVLKKFEELVREEEEKC